LKTKAETAIYVVIKHVIQYTNNRFII